MVQETGFIMKLTWLCWSGRVLKICLTRVLWAPPKMCRTILIGIVTSPLKIGTGLQLVWPFQKLKKGYLVLNPLKLRVPTDFMRGFSYPFGLKWAVLSLMKSVWLSRLVLFLLTLTKLSSLLYLSVKELTVLVPSDPLICVIPFIRSSLKSTWWG